MIRGLGASLVAAAVLATTAGARCLDSATAAFGLAKAVTAAFFESTLGRSSTARCFLRKGLARENATDVRVSLRGPRR